MKNKSVQLIQKSQLSENTFSKNWLINLLKSESDEDVNLFCKEIMLLNELYISTVGLHVTDRPDLIADKESGIFWELKEIDFNQPINFKQIK